MQKKKTGASGIFEEIVANVFPNWFKKTKTKKAKKDFLEENHIQAYHNQMT